MPFYLLSALAAGIVLSFALPSVPPLPVWAAAFCCAAAVFWRRRRAGLWAAVFVAGALWGVWRTEAALDARWPSEKQGQSVALTVHVAGLAQDDGRRVRVLADALADDGRRYRVQLADFGRREWPAGSTWRLNVRLRAPVGERRSGRAVCPTRFQTASCACANASAQAGNACRPRPPRARH